MEVCHRHVRVVLLEELQFLKRPMSDQELFEDLIIVVHRPGNFAAECSTEGADCHGVPHSKHQMGIKVMYLEPMIPDLSPCGDGYELVHMIPGVAKVPTIAT